MPTILRQWRGVIRRSQREEYLDYIRATGLDGYRRTPGNLGASVAARDLDPHRCEILTLSWWDSMASIEAFAGPDVDRARYYPRDDDYLLERPDTVQHYTYDGDLPPRPPAV